MDKSIITFSANEQNLQKTGGIGCYASDTVSYIEAQFALGENWSGYDSIRAVWFNDYKTISTVLDSDGVCIVPHEVLVSRGKVMVNLVGSVLVSDELSDRLTTFPCEALKVSAKAKISGSETAAVTPSQFEQFVEAVKDNADRAEAGAGEAKDEADRAESEAESALASAQASEASALRASGHAQNAQSAETSARAYAQNAQNYATDAENAKDDAIDARDEIRSMRANAETLEPNQSATASYSNGVLTLGIPKGQKGDTGDTGTSAGFGTVSASVDDSTGTPSVEVTTSGTDTAKNFAFAFHNLKGAKGDKGDPGTVPDLDLILPTDTASGDIISIPDGQSVVPVKSLKVTLEPKQDLHGYDKPWSGGAGKNKLPSIGATFTGSGVTWTLNDDGSVKLSGTASANSVYDFGRNVVELEAGTYFANETASGYSVTVFSIVGGTASVIKSGGGQFTLTEKTFVFMRVLVASGTTPNTTIYPQIEKSASFTSYEPYSNICPISGHTECVTEVSGVNVWDEEWENCYYNEGHAGQKVSDNASLGCKNPVPVVPSTTYNITTPPKAFYVLFYDENNDFISHIYYGTSSQFPRLFTTPENCHYITFYSYNSYGTTYNHDISINYPSTDTEYHAYDGDTYTTDLGRTVYGGTLDVVSGELVVDRAMVDLGSLNWTKVGTSAYPIFKASLSDAKDGVGTGGMRNAISNTYPMASSGGAMYNGSEDKVFIINSNYLGGQGSLYVRDSAYDSASTTDFKTAMNGVQLVYELATPQTYQLDPQTISLLKGTNNLWSDGSVVMVYNADVGLYIDKKLGTSGTRTLSMTRTLDTKSEETETKSELTKSDNIQLAED